MLPSKMTLFTMKKNVITARKKPHNTCKMNVATTVEFRKFRYMLR